MQLNKKVQTNTLSNITDLKSPVLKPNLEKKTIKWWDKLRFKNINLKENTNEKDMKQKFIEASKKTVNTVKEKAMNTKETISQSLSDQKNGRTYSILAYLPIAGPIIIFLFKRKQKISIIHATNAACLQISFLAIWLAIWLLENVPVLSNILKIIKAVPFVTNALMWLNIVMLLCLSLYGIFKANQNIGWRVPYLIDFIDKKILKKNPVDIIK